MEQEQLIKAGSVIAKRNVGDHTAGDHLMAVFVGYVRETKALTVVCFFDRSPSDDDNELCGVISTELIAEFSDVRKLDSRCERVDDVKHLLERREGIVFYRDGP